MAPVVIPVLAPTLDKSLKGDRSLCPIRALFLAFGGTGRTDRQSSCPLDRVLTYKNLIYLLNLFCLISPLLLVLEL